MILSLFAAGCSKGSFLGFPTWYEYLRLNDNCAPQMNGINDIWLIVAAIIDILLRLAAIMAVGFIIYGGVTYLTSQGNAESTNRARNTIIAAAVGLLICSIATITVHFVAGRFHA